MFILECPRCCSRPYDILDSKNSTAVRRALLLADVPGVESVHGIILFVALYVVNVGQFLVFLHFVDEAYLELLFFLALLIWGGLFLLSRIELYYWGSKPVEPLITRLYLI